MGNISSKVSNNPLYSPLLSKELQMEGHKDGGFKSRKVNFNIRVHTNQIIYSLLICELFDFLTMEEVMKM